MGMADFLIKLGLDTKNFSGGADKAKAEIQSLGQKIDQTFGGKLGGLMSKALGPGAVIAGATAAAKFVQSQAQAAEQTQKTAKAMGVSVERAQALEMTAARMGAPFEKVKESIAEITKTRSEALMGNAGMVTEYERLGITLDDLKKLSPDEIFQKMNEQAAKGSINAANMASLLKTMGGGAKEMLPFMRDGFGAMAKEAEKFGAVVGRGVTDDLSALNKGIRDVWESTKGWGSYIAQNLVGGLSSLAKLGVGVFETIRSKITGNEIAKETGVEALADRALMFDKDHAAGKNLEDKLTARLNEKKTQQAEKKRVEDAKKAEEAKKKADEAAKAAVKKPEAAKLAEMKAEPLAMLSGGPSLSVRASNGLASIGGYRGGAMDAVQRANMEQLAIAKTQAAHLATLITRTEELIREVKV